MSDEKATAAKRTARKAAAVTRAPKSKRPATRATTKKTASKKTASNASAEVAPAPANVIRATIASKTTTTGRTTKTVAAAAKPTKPKRVASALKAPSAVSAIPEGLGESTRASVPVQAVSKAGAARKAAATEPERRVKQTSAIAKQRIEKPTNPSDDERQRWIATAAYHRAEKRGFAPGYELQDWLDAEAEVNDRIGQARSK